MLYDLCLLGCPPWNEGTFFPSLLSCPSRAHMGQETSHSGLTEWLFLGALDPPNPVTSVLFLKLPGIKLGVCVCVCVCVCVVLYVVCVWCVCVHAYVLSFTVRKQ